MFTLEGVRQHLRAVALPWQASLSLFLLLSSSRKGRYSGKVLLVNERTDKVARYVKFPATFEQDNEMLPLYVEVDECIFPEAGQYNFEVYFSAPGVGETLKGEHPLTVLAEEE